MRIGCPRERKVEEFRVALTPMGVTALRADGHSVFVETGAGVDAGFPDQAYRDAGAQIVPSLTDVYGCDLVIKVKEPIAEEYPLLTAKTTLFCYLHLAAIPELAKVLLAQNVTSVAFETITAPDGSLPLLTPMSMVAGRLAVQVGAAYLQRDHGGKGTLISGLPGVPPAHVLVIGGGVVGQSAIRIAVGMGARVTLADISPAALRRLDDLYHGRIETLAASEEHLLDIMPSVDLLIGAVLIPGARAPKVISRRMLASMEPNSVAVDVSVDQGGCFETTRPTTHRDPVYQEEGVLHYAVTNMPSITSRTSTQALANATLPVLRRLAADLKGALREPHIQNGLTTHNGNIVHPAVAQALGLPFSPYGAGFEG